MSKETQDTLKTIEKKLTTIINLLAYQMVEGKTLAESAPVLRRLGITPSEIAAIFGSTAGAEVLSCRGEEEAEQSKEEVAVVNQTIRRLVLNEFRITKQGLSQRAKRLKDTYGPMTTEEAVYVIAHLEGIDLSKHLPLSVLDRIRAWFLHRWSCTWRAFSAKPKESRERETQVPYCIPASLRF